MDKDSEQMQIQTREYGTSGSYVVLLHGGPGAPGYMVPVARELVASFRILEPFQRGSGKERLTVARHIADLHKLIKSHCGKEHPAIAGHSWGAMLALAYAAEHPDSVASIVLIGCGTFDEAARARMQAIRKERMDEKLLYRIEHLAEEFPDPDQRLAVLGQIFRKIDSYDLLAADDDLQRCDAVAHEETWQDMMRLQEEGVYPAAFSKISVPVIMMHGDFDPHPGLLIRASLKAYLPGLEYCQFKHCGHYPWLERQAHQQFYAILRKWLAYSLMDGR